MTLLAADAGGGLAGGLVLESRTMLAPRCRTAFILAMIRCVALAGFARTHVHALAQADLRGRVIGGFSMSAMGMRTLSGRYLQPSLVAAK